MRAITVRAINTATQNQTAKNVISRGKQHDCDLQYMFHMFRQESLNTTNLIRIWNIKSSVFTQYFLALTGTEQTVIDAAF